VPIAAGVVGDRRIGAVLTARDMAAEGCGAAALDRRHHLELTEAHMAGIGLTPSGPIVAENVRDLQRWARHARCTLGGRLVLGFTLLGHQRCETIQRAHDLADRVGGDVGVERRRVDLRMSE